MNVLNELNSEIENIERKHARIMNGHKPKHHAEQLEQIEADKSVRRMNRSLDLLFAEIKSRSETMKTYEKAYELDGQTARILKFVAAARSKNDYRKFLDVIHVEDGKAVATDGIRLHISDLPLANDKPILEDGDYSILHEGKKKVVVAKIDHAGFPKWKNIIPTEKIDQSLKFYTQSKAHISQEYAALLVNGGEFAAINIKYLEPLVGEAWTVNIRKHPKHNKAEFMYNMYPVEFISACSRAYIMTIMIKE